MNVRLGGVLHGAGGKLGYKIAGCGGGVERLNLGYVGPRFAGVDELRVASSATPRGSCSTVASRMKHPFFLLRVFQWVMHDW